MEKLKLTLTLTILCSIITVDCLQCYVCNDCPKINDTFLVTCGGPVISTTMLPTTLTTTISNTNNDTITTVSNITTSALDTTIVTNATTPVTTGQTLTNTTTTPATPVSQINTTSASNDTINNSNKKILSKLQIRAEVLGNMFGDNISEYKASNTTYMYYCYEGKLKVNTKERIVRGCASNLESSNRTICNDMATDSMMTACRTCTTDKCNSAVAINISLLQLIITITLSLR